jgi:hypothetical protein
MASSGMPPLRGDGGGDGDGGSGLATNPELPIADLLYGRWRRRSEQMCQVMYSSAPGRHSSCLLQRLLATSSTDRPIGAVLWRRKQRISGGIASEIKPTGGIYRNGIQATTCLWCRRLDRGPAARASFSRSAWLRIPCRFCAREVDVLHVGLFTVFLHRCRLGSISSSPLIFC